MERLGLNQAGYRGETIDIDCLLGKVVETAAVNGWTQEILLKDPCLIDMPWQILEPFEAQLPNNVKLAYCLRTYPTDFR